MKGDLTLRILTSNDKTLVYSHLVRATALELFNSELDNPLEPTTTDIYAALMRVAGNSLDDGVMRAAKIIKSPVSTQRFMNSVREAHLWKRQGKW